MYPVLLVGVTNTPIQTGWGEHQNEVSGVTDAVQQIIVKLASTELLNVEEDGETA